MTAAILLLNADMTPIRVLNLQRALSLIFKDRVDFIQDVPEKKLRSPSTELPYPSILRLKRYVNVPRRGAVWSRRAVFARDSYTCQYCGIGLDRNSSTIDHIIPVSRCRELGIRSSSWSNTCCACEKCNRRKSSKTMEEAGMKFFFKDFTPKIPRTNYVVISGSLPDEWRAYLNI
jgi:5-methylcytosine-specific restriction endonuclease McrA